MRYLTEEQILDAIKDGRLKRAVEILLEDRLLQGRYQGILHTIHGTLMSPTEHMQRLDILSTERNTQDAYY